MSSNIKSFTKEINGKKYTAQFYGLRAAMKASKLVRDNENPRIVDMEKLADYILSNVIVEPSGLTIEDFDDFETLDQVVAFGQSVLNNRFRPTEDKSAATK